MLHIVRLSQPPVTVELGSSTVSPPPPPTAPPAAEPLDTATISNPPTRHLWAEAQSLGLLSGAGAVGGPLGQVLSQRSQREVKQVLRHLQLKRGSQTLAPAAAARAVLSKPNGHIGLRASNAPVDSLADLQALEAFGVTGQLDTLPRPHLARALQRIEDSGQHLYQPLQKNPDLSDHSLEFHHVTRRGERTRPLGTYGAYKLLCGPPPEPPILAGTRENWSSRINSEQEALATAYFMYDGDTAGLQHADRAQTLQTLSEDYVMSKDENDWDTAGQTTLTAMDAWNAFEHGASSINVHVPLQWDQPVAPLRVTDKLLDDPARLRRELEDLSSLADTDELLQTMAAENLDQEVIMLVAAAAVPLGNLDVGQRWPVVMGLVDEFSPPNDYMQGPRQVRDDMGFLRDHIPPREEPLDAVEDYMQLMRDLGDREPAREAFDHLRGDISQTDAKRLRGLIGLTKDLPLSRQALDQVAGDAESFDVICRLLHVEGQGARQEESNRPEAATHQMVNGVLLETSEIEREDPGPPRALHAFDLISGHRLPGQSRTAALRTYEMLHQALLPRAGWQAIGDTYAFLQDGSFPGRSPEQAMKDFIDTYLGTGNLDLARTSLLSPPVSAITPATTVERKDGTLLVGGIQVPVRT